MSALTANRDTREVRCNAMNITRQHVVATGSHVYAGSIAASDATGKAVPASDTSGLRVTGRAEHGAAAGETLTSKSGVYVFANSATHPLTAADLNNLCYVEDDQTVAKTGGSNSVKAGVFRGFDRDGVGVLVELGNIRET